MSISARILFSVAILLMVSTGATASPPSDLSNYVEETRERFGVQGIAVTIVEDRAVALSKGFGLRRLGGIQPVDERTLFPIGSNTKSMTAAALAILVERGVLSWDDRVVDRLPGFQMADAYVTRELRVIDLLTHRSGVGGGTGDLLFIPKTDFSRPEILKALRFLPAKAGFREKYQYSNIMYVVAGELIEAVTGITWEDFLSTEIFHPLGMNHSYPARRMVGNEPVTELHVRISGAFRGEGPLSVLNSPLALDNAAPAGGVYTNAEDVASYLMLFTASEPNESKQILSDQQLEKLWAPVTLLPMTRLPELLSEVTPNFLSYALGWRIGDYRGHKIVWHTGGVFGGSSLIGFLPEKNVGVAIMLNGEETAACYAIFYRLLDHYIGAPATNWTQQFHQVQERRFERARAMIAETKTLPHAEVAPSLQIPSFAGTYEDAWYGKIEIQNRDQKLYVNFPRAKGMKGPLEHVGANTFRTRFENQVIEDAYFTFDLNAAGAIARLKLAPVSPLTDSSFDYEDLEFHPVEKAAP